MKDSDIVSKILTIPSTLDEIKKTKDIVDGFIIGIKDMSVNMNLEIDDLSILNEIKDKDIFISINKNIHNTELDKLKQILKDLNNYKIKGVLYSDVALVNLSKKFKLNYDLVWSSEHSVTNYNTINYYNSLGVKYAYLSSDITIEEVKEIKKNTKSKLLFNIFGYLPMFVSRRHIVKNYLNYFNLNDNSTINYIEKEDKVYPIIDNKTHTSVYSNNILNGIKAYLDLDLD